MEILTTIETTRLTELEIIIDHGLQIFVEVGNALLEIRDNRLYRAEYGTFEDYCRERWEMERAHAYRLIDAAKVVNNLSPMGDILPTNERQARPLTKLAPQIQRIVWPIIVDTAINGNITANHIQRTIDEYDCNLDAAPDDDASEYPQGYESRSICPQCGQIYDGDSCPDCPPTNPYNYKRDNRRSVAGDIYIPQGMDACQTPAYAIDPLLPYLCEGWTIWEPARGENLMVDAFYDAGFYVVSGDILTGQNFFDYEPDNWDCLVTNPPYSIQFQWLERCYQLGKPFALLLKVEILGTKTAQEMFGQHGIEVIFISPRINFKMPHKGWDGGGAQFPTAWFTWGLEIGQQMTFAKVVPDAD